jgi:hypothetical protein
MESEYNNKTRRPHFTWVRFRSSLFTFAVLCDEETDGNEAVQVDCISSPNEVFSFYTTLTRDWFGYSTDTTNKMKNLHMAFASFLCHSQISGTANPAVPDVQAPKNTKRSNLFDRQQVERSC